MLHFHGMARQFKFISHEEITARVCLLQAVATTDSLKSSPTLICAELG